MTVIPLTDFVHGSATLREGREHELDQYTAEDLEQRGLVRIKLALPHRTQALPDPANKMAGSHQGKAPAAGRTAPSQSSPAARASAPATATPSSGGETKTRRREK